MVDIIIPIYNAYDDLTKCIDSVKKWTDLDKNRLILIDDCSPDERIKPYLKSIEDKNIKVIFNEKNQGFSGNINLGMSQSEENDVLLLNSDTVVTKKWLDKIVECAYSDVSIATVTPLSNNATLCSVPNFCEENTIPEGFTIDSFADLIETISLNMMPEIPVAHGFCMFVKREVMRKIGMFDAETFGRGYGEENDFCHRAEQIGYHHVMCDNTFIFHSGTSSFLSEEKKRYIEEQRKFMDTAEYKNQEAQIAAAATITNSMRVQNEKHKDLLEQKQKEIQLNTEQKALDLRLSGDPLPTDVAQAMTQIQQGSRIRNVEKELDRSNLFFEHHVAHDDARDVAAVPLPDQYEDEEDPFDVWAGGLMERKGWAVKSYSDHRTYDELNKEKRLYELIAQYPNASNDQSVLDSLVNSEAFRNLE